MKNLLDNAESQLLTILKTLQVKITMIFNAKHIWGGIIFMAYTDKEWRNRIRSRTDITAMLTHLTKPNSDIDLTGLSFDDINLKAVDNLISILKQKKLIGSTSKGYVNGSTPAVCFQDAPVTGLIQNILHEQDRRSENSGEKLRYCGVGMAFMKSFIYKNQGRPVVYDNVENAKSYLPSSHYWRIVSFNLTNANNYIDWTHEREWRLPKELTFEYRQVHILLYSPKCYRYFIESCPKDILNAIGGITTLTVIAL